MPNSISKYIDHTVWYEGSVNTFGDYIGQAVSGVYLLSLKDLKNHGDRIGLISYNYLTGEPTEYVLNSSAKTRSNGSYMYVIKSFDEINDVLYFRTNGANFGSGTSLYAEVRPVFYIDYNFFGEIVLNIDAVGEGVRN